MVGAAYNFAALWTNLGITLASMHDTHPSLAHALMLHVGTTAPVS